MFIKKLTSITSNKRGKHTTMDLEETLEKAPRPAGVGIEEQRAIDYLKEMEE
jgi:hypothetical protein